MGGFYMIAFLFHFLLSGGDERPRKTTWHGLREEKKDNQG